MAYEAEHILYDGISSERFGLCLFNNNGGLDTASGSSFSMMRTPLRGGLIYVSLGKEPTEPLEFKFSMFSKTPLDAQMQGAIHKWLFGKAYKELRIVQPDMTSLRIGCVFTEIEFLQNGNQTVGVSVVGEGDSCYFRGEDGVIDVTGTDGSFFIMNLSDCNEYIYPYVEIAMASGGGDVSIINTTDGNREFSITGLSGDEIVSFDNLRKIITSSSGIRRLSNFNKKWIRLVPGRNDFTYRFSTGSGRIHFNTPVYRMAAH